MADYEDDPVWGQMNPDQLRALGERLARLDQAIDDAQALAVREATEKVHSLFAAGVSPVVIETGQQALAEAFLAQASTFPGRAFACTYSRAVDAALAILTRQPEMGD